MPRWWVLSVLLAGSGAVAAAKMPPKPAAHRPAFILSQEKPEQPPKLAATDVAPAVVKVGRLRGGGRPDEDRVGTACMTIRAPAMLLLTAVYYLLRTWMVLNLCSPRLGFRAFIGDLGTQFGRSPKLGCLLAAWFVFLILVEGYTVYTSAENGTPEAWDRA